MTTNFEALKQNRKSNFDKLTSELNKLNSSVPQGSSEDDRFWKPDVDKAGNGYAIIRFLQARNNEEMPFVRIWDHGFQGPGGWYIEKSLTTLNKPDPVSEMNTKLWNSGIESNKEIVRKQKRRLSYYSNILVIKDPTRPENEGKVFLFKYGKKIWDKINDAMHPPAQFEEKPINPFDYWDGANFKLKIRQVEGYRNYDKSEFDSPSPISNDDKQIEAIWSKQHSLQELLDPKHFKSYEELKMRLEKALGAVGAPTQRAASLDDDEAFPTPQRAAPAPSIPAAKQESAPWDEDDDDLSFFKKLADS